LKNFPEPSDELFSINCRIPLTLSSGNGALRPPISVLTQPELTTRAQGPVESGQRYVITIKEELRAALVGVAHYG